MNRWNLHDKIDEGLRNEFVNAAEALRIQCRLAINHYHAESQSEITRLAAKIVKSNIVSEDARKELRSSFDALVAALTRYFEGVNPEDMFGANKRIDLEIAAGKILERAERCWKSADCRSREMS